MAKILITEGVNPVAPELLTAAGHQLSYFPKIDQETLEKEIVDADAILVRIADLDAETLSKGKNLKVVSKHGVGVDNIDLDYCAKNNIAVTIANGNSISVAEHAMMLMMALAKRVIPVSNLYREVGFSAKNSKEGIQLSGKTVGIVGIGRIGSHMAKLCHYICGTTVLAYDPFVSEAPEGVTLVDDLDELFQRCDVISLHPVLNDSTRHMVDERRLKMMRPTAILINCGRGPMIDEPALIRALESGEIGAAGLDVTESEPLSPDSPLFKMSNVIVTPHFAPTTDDAAMLVAKIAAENIVDVLGGVRPEGQIV